MKCDIFLALSLIVNFILICLVIGLFDIIGG